MACRGAVVLIWVGLALGAAAGASQPREYCRAISGKDPSDAAKYQLRDGRYCDGALFEAHAGDGELPLIALTVGSPAGAPAVHALKFTAVTPRDSVSWPLRFQG